MKQLKLTLLVLISLIGIQVSYGADQPVGSDHYFFGFKTEEEFNLWTVLRLDNDDDLRSWRYSSSTPESTVCTCNLAGQSNDWLISPMVSLTKGTPHFIKVKYNAGNAQKVVFTLGKDKTAEAQTVVLLDSVFNGTSGYLTIKVPDTASGNYYFGVHYLAAAWSGNITFSSFYITQEQGVDLSGTVTNNKSDIVTNAKVSLVNGTYEEMIVEVGEAGNFSFNSLDPGEYQLKVTADGHFATEETVTIGRQALIHPVVLEALINFDVKGCVKSKEGNPVKSAIVTLRGELNYQTVTDESGNFIIEKAREYASYKLKIEKDLKVTYTDVVSVSSKEVDLADIVMETLVAIPMNIKAQEVESGSLLSWMLPLKATEIRYDSGIKLGSYSIGEATEYAVIGNKFDTPVTLKGVRWLANTQNNLVDLYVFALNKDGSVSNEIIYSAKNIPNVNSNFNDNNVWNEHYLPEEIQTPYGCVLALSSTQNLEVYFDSGADEGYPSTYKNCMSYDYRGGLREIWNQRNFFIRLIGSPLGVPQLAPGMTASDKKLKCFKDNRPPLAKAPATGNVTYRVWRFEAQNKAEQDKWTALEINDQNSLSYLDRDYNQLPKGIYQYAVQVIYGDGQESPIGFSNELERKMYARVTISVGTNIGEGYVEGAVATLTRVDDADLTYTAVAHQGTVTFEQIKKGKYDLIIEQRGFNKFTTEPLDFSSDDHYDSSNQISLQLTVSNPFNPMVVQADNSTDVTFSWNVEEGIFEDFEGMQDFVVNPVGKLGWTYADKDGRGTAGVSLCQKDPYPNMYEKMAYMSFNPSQTNPDLMDYLKPHSGNKILVDVAAEEGGNDDYLFSPELSFNADYVLSFYAKAGFFAEGGQEEFMVGYCLASATSENVTWITARPELVGAAWTEFSYNIPKAAKFITIRCVSNQKFFFLLDDIYIGYRRSLADQLANYEVYLDEEKVGKTGDCQMTFPNLSKGKHITKVQSVHTLIGESKIYSDFVELAFTVKAPDGIKENTVENLYQYDSRNGIVTFTEATQVTVYSTLGERILVSAEAQMNVSGWQTGLYLFVVKAHGSVNHYKIFVK